MRLTINSQNSLSSAIGKLRETFNDARYFTITIKTGKKRTLSQNAISHRWYSQVSKEEGEYTEEGVKCLCKLHFGLPMMRGVDEEFNAACEKVIDPLPYESQVEAMRYFPCTSLMDTKQLSRYLEQVQAHYVGRVLLEFTD